MQKLVVFDVDGTLVQSVAVDDKCFVSAVEEVLGIEGVDSDWMQYTFQTDSGLLKEIGVRHLGMTPSENTSQQVQKRFMELIRVEIQNGQRPLVEIPGAQKLLVVLKENDCWKVAIATGGWEKSAHFKLEAVGIDIDGIPIATADDSEDRVKIIEQAITRAKGTYCCDEFAKVVYVGDAKWDIAAARVLKLNFVGVGEGKVADELLKHGATSVVSDFTVPDTFIDSLEAVGPEEQELGRNSIDGLIR